MRLKVMIGLWISLIVLGNCEHRADYLNWSRKVANYCKYVKYSEESKRYECGPKLGEFYTYIIIHPDYILPKNPIYPLVAYDGNDNVVMVGGNGRGQIWRMIKFEIWAFVRETKTGMKEVYYDEDEGAFIGLEIGDNKEDIKSKAWWSKDGGKSWVRAKVPLFKKKEENNSNSVLSVPPVVELTPKATPTTSVVSKVAPTPVGEPLAPTPLVKPLAPTPVLKPLAPTPVLKPLAPTLVVGPTAPPKPFVAPKPKLPVGGVAEAVGGGYAVAIGKVGGKATVWSSKATVPRNWEVTLEKDIKNPHTGSLPISLQKFSKSSLVDLKKVLFDGTDFRIEDKDGDVWSSRDNGKSWEIGRFGGGSGTVGAPYEIENAAHLWLVREELNKHFKLTKDLDLSVITEEEGFDPIGDWDGAEFKGTFDGKGKVIRNLKIDRPTESGVALFGIIIRGAVLKNIGLEDVDVEGIGNVGGLVGYNYGGTIEESYATGQVTGTGSYVGGLVGYNVGTIEKSYAKVTVTGGRHVGGFVGWNQGGTIKNSYAMGKVTGTGGGVGGFIGLNWLFEGIFEKNYWKEGSASKGVGQGSGANVERKTEAELKALTATETG